MGEALEDPTTSRAPLEQVKQLELRGPEQVAHSEAQALQMEPSRKKLGAWAEQVGVTQVVEVSYTGR